MPEKLLIAILAAGASRRLGQPKQLVGIDGKPLLRRQCEVALDADIGPVAAILGCDADVFRGVIQDLPVAVHINFDWVDGLGSSIACAARAAGAGLLILHGDQFSITSADLRNLYDVWLADRAKAVRSRAGSYLGPPVIFPASALSELRNLTGDDGAKAVMRKLGPANVIDVDISSAADDLDTPEQLAKLQ
jgi:molybdenum cofactor cytidylyltransferase